MICCKCQIVYIKRYLKVSLYFKGDDDKSKKYIGPLLMKEVMYHVCMVHDNKTGPVIDISLDMQSVRLAYN